MDLTLISYKVTHYAVLYNLILFAVWLIMVKREGGRVSEVYLIVMGLFVARLYGVWMGIRARELRYDHDVYYEFMSGTMWESRLTPEAVIFIILAVVLTRRFVRSYWYNDPDYKARNGRRKEDKINR